MQKQTTANYSKLLLIFIFFLFCNVQLKAQYQTLNNANQQLRHIFSQISFPNPNIEFLNERSAKLADSLLYQKNNPDTIHQMQWYQVYKEMYYAAHDTLAQQPFNNVMLGANNYGIDTITMGIMDWDFYRVKPQATTSANYFSFDVINNYFLDHPNPIASPYTTDNVFMAAPLLNKASFLQVVYNIDPQFLFRDNNTQHFYQNGYQLQIDFGDGNGFVTINTTTANFITVTYPNNGEKIITTRIISTKGRLVLKSSVSRLGIANNKLLATPDEILTNIPGMSVSVFNSCKAKGGTNRKIILVEGFDFMDEIPSQNSTASELYQESIESEQLDHLRNFGYEYYVVDWKESKIDMRFNAYHLMCLIEYLKSKSTNNQEFVIIGVSMGGVIARYTLNFMESKNYLSLNANPFFIEENDPENLLFLSQHPNFKKQWEKFRKKKKLSRRHNTRLLITVDSPHQGANIPLAYQYLFRKLLGIAQIMPGLALVSTQIPQLSVPRILNRKATRQLLKWYVPIASTPVVSYYPPSPSHISFFRQLRYHFVNGGVPLLAKTVALSDGAIDGARQQDPQTNLPRNFNDDLINFKFDSRVKILWSSFDFISARARLRTNPNGFGEIATASMGVNVFKIKIKFFSIKITKQYQPTIPLVQKYAINAQPTCVTAGGNVDLFQFNNSVYNTNWSKFHGHLGFSTTTSITTNGIGFCFVPLESALDYNGQQAFNNNIKAANINDKLNRNPFSVIAGQVYLGENKLTGFDQWKNHGHVENRNDQDLIYNLTQLPAAGAAPNTKDEYAYYTCAQDKNYEAKRTFLSLEIGDEELYLENFVTDRKADYRTEFDIKVNFRNPHYEYSSQQPLIPSLDGGVYSKENPFNVVGNGFATFYYDTSSPSPSPGLSFNYLNTNNYNKIDKPLYICCTKPSNKRVAANKMVTEKGINKSIEIYPNPASQNEQLYISATVNSKNTTAILSIYNVDGKLMYNSSLQSSADGRVEHQINLTLLPLKKGIYFIKLTNTKETFNTKFVVN